MTLETPEGAGEAPRDGVGNAPPGEAGGSGVSSCGASKSSPAMIDGTGARPAGGETPGDRGDDTLPPIPPEGGTMWPCAAARVPRWRCSHSRAISFQSRRTWARSAAVIGSLVT
jgi:hypothetical protein